MKVKVAGGGEGWSIAVARSWIGFGWGVVVEAMVTVACVVDGALR